MWTKYLIICHSPAQIKQEHIFNLEHSPILWYLMTHEFETFSTPTKLRTKIETSQIQDLFMEKVNEFHTVVPVEIWFKL